MHIYTAIDTAQMVKVECESYIVACLLSLCNANLLQVLPNEDVCIAMVRHAVTLANREITGAWKITNVHDEFIVERMGDFTNESRLFPDNYRCHFTFNRTIH